jgi:hypothetical protein
MIGTYHREQSTVSEAASSQHQKQNMRKKIFMSLEAFVTFIVARDKKWCKRNGGDRALCIALEYFFMFLFAYGQGSLLRDKVRPSETGISPQRPPCGADTLFRPRISRISEIVRAASIVWGPPGRIDNRCLVVFSVAFTFGTTRAT